LFLPVIIMIYKIFYVTFPVPVPVSTEDPNAFTEVFTSPDIIRVITVLTISAANSFVMTSGDLPSISVDL